LWNSITLRLDGVGEDGLVFVEYVHIAPDTARVHVGDA
jgi:hypothetical protein